MFLRNRLLLFFVGILIANTCFDADGFDYVPPSRFYMPLVINDCAEDHYIAKCGDIELDLNTIYTYLNDADPENKCWDPDKKYENMRNLFKIENFPENDYCGELTDDCDDEGNKVKFLCKVKALVDEIKTKCIDSSIVCKKCPNDGYTNEKSSIADGAWVSFNTIADCYTQGGSDAKGAFTVKNNNAPANKCYYNYYSE